MATDGIKIQAQTWGKELIRRGHIVDFINMWDNVDWKSYDIIHLFDYSEWMEDFIFWMKDVNTNIVISPIIDSMYNKTLFRLVGMWGSRKLRLRSRYYSLRQCRNYIKMFFVDTVIQIADRDIRFRNPSDIEIFDPQFLAPYP